MGSSYVGKWREMGGFYFKKGFNSPFYFAVIIYIYTTSELHVINAAYDKTTFITFSNNFYLPANLKLLELLNSFKSEDLGQGNCHIFFCRNVVLS